jgi:serine/threonine protein kinase
MLEHGTVIGGYRINRVLGAGGMGVVYEATQLSLERTVALKVLAHEYSDDPTFRKRFRREGQLQGALDHPHIVTVHEAGETEHGLFIAMRLVRGPTLKDMIVSRELDAGRALRVLRPVAGALDAAHEAGLTHRDVKPQNILVAGRDHPYLADFGLTQPSGGTHITATGQFVGTFDYIAPEQIRGEDPTPAVDVYAFAGVLYECLTGQVPFPGRSQAAVIYAHMAIDPPLVTEQRPEMPDALDGVVARGMAKNPTERPPSASALIEAAEHAFDRRSRAVLRPPGPIESPEEVGVRSHEGAVSTAQGPIQHGPTSDTASTVGRSSHQDLPQPTERAPTSRARRRPWLAVGASALAAATAGAVLGIGGGGADGDPGMPNSASAGAIELRYGPGLERADSGPRIPGLPADALRLRGGAGAGITAAMTDAADTTLLPDALRKAVAQALPSASEVRAGEATALRYSGLRLRDVAEELTVYAAPTTAGVATIVCHGPATFAARCAGVAQSLELHGTKPLPVGPSSEYAAALTRVLRSLSRERDTARGRLAAARLPRSQASAAEALAGAYRSAQRAVAELNPSPAIAGPHAAIDAALSDTQDAYGRLARAAQDGDRGGYKGARRGVAAGERDLRRALLRLKKAGYRVR